MHPIVAVFRNHSQQQQRTDVILTKKIQNPFFVTLISEESLVPYKINAQKVIAWWNASHCLSVLGGGL